MFEWDSQKNLANTRKHGISFDRALEIFTRAVMRLPSSKQDCGEPRFVSIGMMDNGLIIAVVHTDRNGTTRIISARPAKRKERSIYYACQIVQNS